MFTVTFYSFKGGVGRTFALMNVAVDLVKQGKNVTVLDFDLEAPGLNSFKELVKMVHMKILVGKIFIRNLMVFCFLKR